MPLDIGYSEKTDFLSINIQNDTLFNVAKRITEVSPHNIVLAPSLEGMSVSAFIKNRPFDDAIDNFAFANGLSVRKTESNFYVIEEKGAQSESDPEYGKTTNQITAYSRPNVDGLQLKAENNRITIRAEDAELSEVITAVAYELNAHYYMFSTPEGKGTLFIENASFDEFLSYIFSGTKFTFKRSEDI